MIVKPRLAEKRLELAVLVDRFSALHESGRLIPLRPWPAGVRLFAAWELTDHLLRQGVGEHVCWGDEPIRWRLEPSRAALLQSDAIVLRYELPEYLPSLLRGLVSWRDWLWRHGATLGWSMGGSSMNLLRATLEHELVTSLGELPRPRWTLGGRQQAYRDPGTVRGAVHVDLQAAYPRVLGNLRYGGAWRRLERPSWDELELLGGFKLPILARGEARVSGVSFGPLPQRPRRRPGADSAEMLLPTPYPSQGRLLGMWTFQELDNLVKAGGSFKCREAWFHNSGRKPFKPWLDAVEGGRRLEDPLGRFLVKASAAALWGQFVIDDRKQLRSQAWHEGYRYRLLPTRRGQHRAWDVGELVTGQVRAKLWPLIETAGPDRFVCAHTDGIWAEGVETLSLERAVKGARVKETALELQFLDQQKLRFRTATRPRRWRYTFSGVPGSRAEEVFEQLWQPFAA